MLPTHPEPDHTSERIDAAPAAPPTETPLQSTGTWSPRRAARIAGASYLFVNATAFFSLLFINPRIYTGDPALTARNIAAHSTLYRLGIVVDLLTIAGDVVLALALYELLKGVHRSLAALATLWRVAEAGAFAAILTMNFAVLSLLTVPGYLGPFEQEQLNALARLLGGARANGFWVAMFFLLLGSAANFYLLLRSRFVPRLLALSGLVASGLMLVHLVVRFLSPATLNAAVEAVTGLPLPALVVVGVVAVPILAFELTTGAWLLFKGIRPAEERRP